MKNSKNIVFFVLGAVGPAGAAAAGCKARATPGPHRGHCIALRDAGARPQHRGGLCRPARPGYVASSPRRLSVRAAGGSPHLTDHFPAVRPCSRTAAQFAVAGDPGGARVGRAVRRIAGAPTLKLRGDYLAIVTLGFGEIIRVFLNTWTTRSTSPTDRRASTAIDPIHFWNLNLGKPLKLDGFTISSVTLYYYLFLALVISPSSFRIACRSRASAAPGWPFAKTRSPPRRWASTPAT